MPFNGSKKYSILKYSLLDNLVKLRPEKYKPVAEIRSTTACFKVFVFIIGGITS
jgi:Trm5-related predicted tRNA methylase